MRGEDDGRAPPRVRPAVRTLRITTQLTERPFIEKNPPSHTLRAE
jgi:hypothetical protein